jgi:ABC-type glycerol-3-phosphate transport system substrate-binding protein
VLRAAPLGLGAAALAACVPGETAAPRMDAKDVTLTYLTDWANNSVRNEWVKQAIPRFTEEFPKIRVQVEAAGNDSAQAILTGSAAGTLQDVFFNENDVFQKLAHAGDLKDIAPVLKSLKYNPNDIVSIPSGYMYKGKQHGLPLQLTIQTMMINKTLFKENGVTLPDKTTTWPQFFDMLKRVTKPADNIFGYLGNNNWPKWLPFVWGYGGERWSPDLKKSLFGEPAAIEGLQAYVDMTTRLQVSPPLNDNGGVVPSGVSFNAGKLGSDTAASPGAGTHTGIGGKFDWDIMYTPLGPRTGKRYVFTNTNANVVSGTAVKRGVFDQAVQLVGWISGSKVSQDIIVKTGASTPVYKPVLTSPEFLAGPPVSNKIVVEMIPDWKDPDIFIGWNEYRDSVLAEFLPAFTGKRSVPDAAKEMARVGQIVLDKIPK